MFDESGVERRARIAADKRERGVIAEADWGRLSRLSRSVEKQDAKDSNEEAHEQKFHWTSRARQRNAERAARYVRGFPEEARRQSAFQRDTDAIQSVAKRREEKKKRGKQQLEQKCFFPRDFVRREFSRVDYHSFDSSPTGGTALAFGCSTPPATFRIGESTRKLGKNDFEETRRSCWKTVKFPRSKTFRGGGRAAVSAIRRNLPS